MEKWIKYTYIRILKQKIDPNKLVIGTFASSNDYKYVSCYLHGYFVDDESNCKKGRRWGYIPLSKFIGRERK